LLDEIDACHHQLSTEISHLRLSTDQQIADLQRLQLSAALKKSDPTMTPGSNGAGGGGGRSRKGAQCNGQGQPNVQM
jgi:hypothetical protein